MYEKKNKLSKAAPILIKISARLSRAVYRNNINEKFFFKILTFVSCKI